MLSVDTNVVVRFLTGDDADQALRARELIASHDVWVGVTVALETEWVLRSVHGYAPTQISGALRALAGLPRVEIESAVAVARALALHDAGMDFADALHLATADHCEAFVTFDKRCVEVAKLLGLSAREP
jgi:predicted nucleic acid-binding protein